MEKEVPVNGTDNDVDTQPVRRGRKRTSKAWSTFEKPVEINGKLMARCMDCKNYLTAKSTGGTSHLLDHASFRCPKRHLKCEIGQQTLDFENKNGDGVELVIESKFKQELSRSKMVNMIIIHEYPLSMVDHFAFRDFVASLNSKFKMITRNTLRSDILKMFASEKLALKKFLENHDSRVALTTDMWTASNQKKGYMAVTAHFIDNEWILRNRTLRFSYVPSPHTKDVLAAVLMECVYEYGLDNKLSSIVLDNCSTNDAMLNIIKGKFDPRSLILGGDFIHMRCCAHILNLSVKDVLNAISGEINLIRENVGFWLQTPKRFEKFEDAARACKVSSTKRPILDCNTRWNSTYLMLETSIPYKDVFSKLERLNPRLKMLVPSEMQWEFAIKVCKKLEVFYKVTELFSGRNYPTSNLYFSEVCEMKIQLKSWLMFDDPIIVQMATNMIRKFDKYWSNINGLMAVATVLDPRLKMDCVDFFFKLIYEDTFDVEKGRIETLLADLMLEYKDKANTSVESDILESAYADGGTPNSNLGRSRNSYSVHKQKNKKRKLNVNAELSRYLEDEELPDDADILAFWRVNSQYPTLREIAKDLLAIPVSSVASESVFSTSGRVLSPHRSRLHSNTVEALMCLQNWKTGGCSVSPIKNSFAYADVFEDLDEGSQKNGAVDEYEGNDVYMTCNF